MRVAVSGVNGFVGAHLAQDLATAGHEVLGLGKGAVAPAVGEILVGYVDQDLRSGWPDLAAHGVDAVAHLAGLSAVGPSFADPQGYLEGNSAPMTHLGEQMLTAGSGMRLLVVSTGAVYAPGVGVDETSPTVAGSPYAVSKLLVETQCDYYRRRGLDVVVVRPFNHIGPGQQPGFLLPDLIAGLRSGALTVGDLDTRRDYTDVRDVVRAYRLALEAPAVPPVLNICSGTSVSGRTMLMLAAEALGIQDPEVSVDRARLRPDDPRDISGDHSLATEVLGWSPGFALEQTVADTVAATA